MFKKLILVTAMMVASSVALANGAPYVGASAGVNTDVFNVKDDFGNTINFGGRGAVGNIFAGYGAMISQSFYLGGEVFADLTNTTSDISLDNDAFKDKFKEKYGYGISIIPGIAFSDHTMAYARLGIIRSRFETKETAPVTASEEKSLTGAQFGLGMQTSLTQNIDLRGEYDFNAYSSGNFNGNSVKPRSDQFNLGLIYKFE
ncbi:MAG: hypothetical protein A3F11_05580 [Gammaproteobacteria bacterium RIFCSPHIGHO2_12_FULL_37_14]|nr:MAG: hypothetical protein A3F11_05580 [Gammaproteobacteria bacterium RIFCSPHIGHO2_12_FULL_37_14]